MTMSDVDRTTTPHRVTYEYIDVLVRPEQQAWYQDIFQSFGWVAQRLPQPHGGTVNLRFRRDREWGNRPLLVELQRRSEQALAAIETLERSRTITATLAAWGVGVVGAMFFAASILGLAGLPTWLLLLLGVNGLLVLGLACLVHTRATGKRTAEVVAEIERRKDAIRAYCHEAAQLLDGSTR